MRDKGFDKLVEAAAERVILTIQSGVGVCYRCGENNILERVGKLEKKVARCIPTAESKTGRWVDDEVTSTSRCSICGAEFNWFDNDVERFNFCPNCGAKMKGEADG